MTIFKEAFDMPELDVRVHRGSRGSRGSRLVNWFRWFFLGEPEIVINTPVPVSRTIPQAIQEINRLCKHVRQLNDIWWVDIETDEPLERNKGEQLMLIVSEIAECMEGVRKELPDDKLPHRSMEEVELADAVIRIFDYCGGHKLDLAGAIAEKLEFNKTRADHTREGRQSDGGKKF